jgi:hypothetical protein
MLPYLERPLAILLSPRRCIMCRQSKLFYFRIETSLSLKLYNSELPSNSRTSSTVPSTDELGPSHDLSNKPDPISVSSPLTAPQSTPQDEAASLPELSARDADPAPSLVDHDHEPPSSEQPSTKQELSSTTAKAPASTTARRAKGAVSQQHPDRKKSASTPNIAVSAPASAPSKPEPSQERKIKQVVAKPRVKKPVSRRRSSVQRNYCVPASSAKQQPGTMSARLKVKRRAGLLRKEQGESASRRQTPGLSLSSTGDKLVRIILMLPCPFVSIP